MNDKKYLLSKIAFGFFTVTTVLLLLALRDPQGLRSRGLTDSIAVTIVLINFVLLVASILFFVYQRANRVRPSKNRRELLDAFAESTLYGETQTPEATSIRHEDLMKLDEPFAQVVLPVQGRLAPDYLKLGQTVKLTSEIKPPHFVIAEIIDFDSDTVTLRRTGM